MVARLVAVSGAHHRRSFLLDLALHDAPGEVQVSPGAPDRVTSGIARRFTACSRYTCHACGRPGVARDRLGGAVRCAACASAAILRAETHVLRVELQRVERGGATSVEWISDELVPPLLRPALRKSVGFVVDAEFRHGVIPVVHLVEWARHLSALTSAEAADDRSR
jgi:hypothetical protein